jgi:hypothetical protein
MGIAARMILLTLSIPLTSCASADPVPAPAPTAPSAKPERQLFEPPPGRQLSPQEWCADALRALALPYADSYLKAALLEKIRNRGCLK